MLKNKKSANRDDHQNRKTDLKNSQNRKTENPNAPPLGGTQSFPEFSNPATDFRRLTRLNFGLYISMAVCGKVTEKLCIFV